MTFLRKGLKTATLVLALAAGTFSAAAPAQARGHRGGNYAAIAIGAGVVGLAIGAAIASDNNRGYYDNGYYRSYPVYQGGYYNNGYPQYRGYPRYRAYPAYRGYDYRYQQQRRWRQHERWEHRGGYGRGW